MYDVTLTEQEIGIIVRACRNSAETLFHTVENASDEPSGLIADPAAVKRLFRHHAEAYTKVADRIEEIWLGPYEDEDSGVVV